MHQNVPHGPHEEEHEFDHHDHALTRRGFIAGTLGAIVTTLGCRDSSPSHPMTSNEHQLSDEQRELLEQYFSADQEIYDEIAKIGFQEYVQKHHLTDQHIVFTPEEAEHMDVEFCCSDEGIEDKTRILVRTPGSLMIQAKDRADKNPMARDFVQWVAKEVLEQGGTIFTGHKGCGAGKAILAQRMAFLGKIKNADKPTKEEVAAYLTPDQVDAFVQEFTALVVAEMKVQEPTKAGKITGSFIEKLARPPSLHPGRCLYLTSVKNFDSTCPGLPRGYVETVLHIDNLVDSLDHAEALCDIAMSDHGVGPKVTEEPKKQFVICCVTETKEELELLKRDAQSKIDALGKKRPGIAKKFRVDGFSLTA